MSTQETSFNSREELLQWIMDKKPIRWSKQVYRFDEKDYSSGPFKYVLKFTEKLEEYSKVFEKEKVMFYRYTYKHVMNDFIQETGWTTRDWESWKRHDILIIKTESKIVEVD